MPTEFAPRLIAWHAQHGRHDLPWQNTRDAYAIWVSEIMLQQTQVATVIPYYQRFMVRFPDVSSLATAHEDEVLAHWSGLGYYSRARNLHTAAQQLMALRGGAFPRDAEAIATLPGIGRSTAAAIAAFAFGARDAILDGNVKRVLTRCFGVAGFPGDKKVETALWVLAESLLPARDIETYTQALMDLGATLCTRSKPRCMACPMADDCVALCEGRVDELPTSKPKKALPERETVMLILRHGPEVLLEKRPARGIWGGLWSFPEVTPDTVLDDYLHSHHGSHATQVCALPTLRHAFTHFRLHIRPLLVDVSKPDTRPGAVWLDLDSAQEAALPTPVRTLLALVQTRGG